MSEKVKVGAKLDFVTLKLVMTVVLFLSCPKAYLHEHKNVGD